VVIDGRGCVQRMKWRFSPRVSKPSRVISLISLLTIGRELPIISAKSSCPNSGIRSVPRLSSMPTRVPSLLSTISSRTRNEEPMKVMYRSNVVDQAVLSYSSMRTAV